MLSRRGVYSSEYNNTGLLWGNSWITPSDKVLWSVLQAVFSDEGRDMATRPSVSEGILGWGDFGRQHVGDGRN